jgi:sulfane dehydrogenase subunit SoxC
MQEWLGTPICLRRCATTGQIRGASVSLDPQHSGRLRKAPENFIDQDGVRTVFREAKDGRRDFIRGAFAAAMASAAAPAVLAQSNPVPAEGGDPTS